MILPVRTPDKQAMTRFVVLMTALLVTSACAAATSVPASPGPWQFSGTVFATDGQQIGAPVPGARLTVEDADAVRASTTTDAAGRYAFNALEAGRFTLTISAPGFVTLTPGLNLDRDIRADFALTRQ